VKRVFLVVETHYIYSSTNDALLDRERAVKLRTTSHDEAEQAARRFNEETACGSHLYRYRVEVE
jgi:hypothetical protein